MDNIIKFPIKVDPNTFPINIEQSYDHIEGVRRDYCEEVSSDVMEAVFSVMTSYGMHITPTEDVVKNIVFIEEAIKALLFSMKKIHHPFQELAEQTITLTDDAHKELKEIVDRKAVEHLTD